MARAPDLHSGGQGFEPLILHTLRIIFMELTFFGMMGKIVKYKL